MSKTIEVTAAAAAVSVPKKPELVKFIVQGEPYYDNATGGMYKAGQVVELPLDKAPRNGGWVFANSDGSPKLDDEGKPMVLKKSAAAGTPFHLLGEGGVKAGPSVDSELILALAGKVAVLESKVAELEAAAPKKK